MSRVGISRPWDWMRSLRNACNWRRGQSLCWSPGWGGGISVVKLDEESGTWETRAVAPAGGGQLGMSSFPEAGEEQASRREWSTVFPAPGRLSKMTQD